MKKRLPKKSGIAIAIAAAGLVAGCANFPATSATATSTDLIHCYGVNKCNGHNDCKTPNNACNGQVSCKGHGYVNMPSKACGDVGGKIGS